MEWFRDLFIDEVKPCLSRESGGSESCDLTFSINLETGNLEYSSSDHILSLDRGSGTVQVEGD